MMEKIMAVFLVLFLMCMCATAQFGHDQQYHFRASQLPLTMRRENIITTQANHRPTSVTLNVTECPISSNVCTILKPYASGLMTVVFSLCILAICNFLLFVVPDHDDDGRNDRIYPH